LPALCKLLLTNVGVCCLLTHGGDASLRHRHAILCVLLFYQILFEMIRYDCIRNAVLLYPWVLTFAYDAIRLWYLI
jgi:hypothetical protein